MKIELNALMTLVLLLVGCASGDGSVTHDVVEEDANALEQVIAGNQDFAFDLYQSLIDSQHGNLFFSPHSISTALAMTYTGSDTLTAHQMSQVLHLPQDRQISNAGFSLLASRVAAEEEHNGYVLRLANRLWGQEGFPFREDYLTSVGSHFKSGLQTLDFARNVESARCSINEWVAEETNNRIAGMLPAGSLGADTRLVLTNAIYFLGKWQEQFAEHLTRNHGFELDSGTVDVDMMWNDATFPYAYDEGIGLSIVELPYTANAPSNQSIAMIVLVPESRDGLAQVERELSAAKLSSMMDQMTKTRVRLGLPKFRLEQSFGLKESLSAMGMSAAFSPPNADFSRMADTAGGQRLFLSDVVHKTYIEVDEGGTEAAGSTAVPVTVTSVPLEPEIQVVADRPFLFLIRDEGTGTILFMGRIVDGRSIRPGG